MNALGKRIKKPRPLSSKDDNEDSVKLTDLDKLYLALAETKEAPIFDVLYYGLDITSIEVLKEYSFFEAKKWLPRDSFERLKHKICDKHFDFHELAQKFKCGDVAETCSKNGIPIIKKEDVSEVKYISWGPLFDCVCEALMKTHDGVKQKVCLRFNLSDLKSLREAEMSILLRHPNILHLYGVIISSSFSPSVALASVIYPQFYSVTWFSIAFQSTGFDNESAEHGYFRCKVDCKCLGSEPCKINELSEMTLTYLRLEGKKKRRNLNLSRE